MIIFNNQIILLFHYIVESKILKNLHSKIFPANDFPFFKMTIFVKSSEPIFTFAQRKNYMFVSTKKCKFDAMRGRGETKYRENKSERSFYLLSFISCHFYLRGIKKPLWMREILHGS